MPLGVCGEGVGVVNMVNKANASGFCARNVRRIAWRNVVSGATDTRMMVLGRLSAIFGHQGYRLWANRRGCQQLGDESTDA
jgi:hypothetical protein